MGKQDLSSFVNKAKENTEVKVPKQKVVPIKENKRDLETQYSLWIDKKLLKKVQGKALKEDTSVKDLIIEAMTNNL